jgi:trimethylamine--corrinoid protein Co-methyltransferase
MTYRLSIATEAELDKLHDTSLKILKETGIRFMHEDALAIFRENGFKIEDDIVYITEAQVNKALDSCPPSFEFQALDPARNLIVGEDFVHAQPNAGAVFVHDSLGGHRKATLEDHANLVKICQKLDSISLNGSIPVDPSDVSQKHKHMHMLRESLKYTDKPIMGMAMDRLGALQQMDLMDIAIGEDRNLKDAQAGFESMMSMMFGFMGGANILVQALGTLEALMSTSYEKTI